MPYTGSNAVPSGSGSGWANRQKASFIPGGPTKNTKVTFNEDDMDMEADVKLSNDDEDSDSYSDSESDTSEDSQGEELTPALDAAILRTLGMIRNKDEVVYGGGNVLQEELQKSTLLASTLPLPPTRSKSLKPFTLQDHQRSALLAASRGDLSKLGDDEVAFVPPSTTIPLSNVQAERQLRAEVLSAFHASVKQEDEDEEDDGFLSKKEKTEQEVDEEQEAYRRFLLESGGGEEEVRRILTLGPRAAIMRDEGGDVGAMEEVEEAAGMGEGEVKREKKERRKRKRAKKDDEEFLMNYILNRGWIDTSETPLTRSEIRAKNARIDAGMDSPDEFEGEGNDEATEVKQAPAGEGHPWGALEEEDEFDERAEEFETAYNFRFEEPGAAEIPSHPRSIPTLVRRLPEARKIARLTRAERKAEEKAKREEETRRLKGKKRREIQARLEKLKEELGGDFDLQGLEGLEEELEGEWDEGRHERMMERLLGKDDDDDEKPTWGDDDMGEGYEGMDMDEGEYAGGEGDMDTGAVEEDEDAPINMDADFMSAPTESKNKRKKSKKGKERRAEEDVELEDDEGLSVEAKKEKIKEAVKEYEGLDHEDMIGDLPTRFKYAQTAPSSYGLTPAEILLATDAELNQFLGVKHLAPYRHGSDRNDRGMGKRLWELKKELKGRRWGEEVVEKDGRGPEGRKADQGWKGKRSGGSAGGEGADGKKKKRKGKKERSRTLVGGEVPETGDKRKNGDEGGNPSKRVKV